MKLRHALAAVALTVATSLVAASPAAPSRAGAAECEEPAAVQDVPPWPQLALGPERAWPFSRGAGITVAVLDSGVDANQPRLRNHVLHGYDALAGGGRADSDCVGTGTKVAGLIAAQPADGDRFAGFAPDVQILPVRVVAETTQYGPVADAGVLAKGIDAAVDQHADVIAVSAVSYGPDGRLEAAIARALAQNVTVVAAVGNKGAAGNDTPYPAAYPGVIGVGATDVTGARWASSQFGDYVDLVAPGAQVPTLQRVSGMTLADGTGLACAFVAATAALVRARWGDTLPGSQVANVLVGTAIPAAAGPYYGHGTVEPYAAVTNQISAATPAALPPPPAPAALGDDPAAKRRQALALAGAAAAVLAAIMLVVVAFAVPRGRRRFWRGTLAPRPVTATEPDEPGPPLPLFDTATTAPAGRPPGR